MTTVSPGRVEAAMLVLETAAAKGDRCPMSDQIPGGAAAVSVLAHDGRIFVEVFDKNFRRVTIMEGEEKGKSTASPPLNHHKKAPRPYLTVGKEGTFRNGFQVDTGYKRPITKAAGQPSALFVDGRRVRPIKADD